MYSLFSVDDHIIEPADVWSGRVPAKFRETAPHVVYDEGREYWVFEGDRQLHDGPERRGRQAAGNSGAWSPPGSPT